ncbi:MAG: RecQ family ATP-dependent DNA helicase [Pseudobdellovibrio sp.]
MNLEQQLQQTFGFEQFRFPQKEIIEKVLAGGSLLALMPTGAGKSLTYQMLSLYCEKVSEQVFKEIILVISPLIALMQDQTQKAQELGIRATFINSSIGPQEKNARMKKISEGQFQLLFVTPERFRKEEFLDCINSIKVKVFVVDEAHCASLWGHDFRPDYSKLQTFRKRLGNPPVLALTATATEDVQSDITKQFNLHNEKEIIFGGLARPELALNVIETYTDVEKNENLLKYISENTDTSGIVYFTLVQTLEKAAQFLTSKKINFLKYFGDLPGDVKKRNQNLFLKGEVKWILATPAFGLGIDKADVRTVIHYEIPSSIEAYFQEVGRAGRDRQKATGYFLYSEDDLMIQMDFLNWAYPDQEFIEKVYDLILTKPAIVALEGFEYLREQMVFKNRKDFRVNAAVSILQRWGCLEENETPFGFVAVTPPTQEHFKLEDQAVLKKEHQKKLLALLRYIQNTDECRLVQIYNYFGHKNQAECGHCDVCS